jgi:UDP-N-acetylmuramyl pentapeptide synthase
MMNDKKLQKLMDDTFNACVKHVTLLRQLEDEYKRRFGHYPADVDDDWFIDSFSYGSGGKTTVKIMTENALLHKSD